MQSGVGCKSVMAQGHQEFNFAVPILCYWIVATGLQQAAWLGYQLVAAQDEYQQVPFSKLCSLCF